MIKIILLFILFFFTACSFSTPPNEWQYKTSNSFELYVKSFLSSKEVLSEGDFKRAVKHAKHSSNLDILAKIYLGRCAIRNSVGIEDSCKEFVELKSLVDSKSLNSYYLFITKKLKIEDVEYLPSAYKDFAQMYLNKNYIHAKKEMFNIEKLSSKLIAANMIKRNMNTKDIEKLLEDISFYGYKKSVLYWLGVLKSKTNDTQKIKKIDKKIKILKS